MQPPGGVPKMLSSFLQSLVLLTLTGKLLKKLHPAPLYCLSSEPDYVAIKKSNHFHPFYTGSRDSRTAQLAVWML